MNRHYAFGISIVLSFFGLFSTLTGQVGQNTVVYLEDVPFLVPETFLQQHVTKLGLSPKEDQFLYKGQIRGLSDMVHHRYVHYHKDTRVFGGNMTVHTRDGKVTSITGNQRSAFAHPSEVRLSKDALERHARLVFQTVVPKDNVSWEERNLDIQSEWIWMDPLFPEGADSLVLALEVNLKNLSDDINYNLILNAQTGQLIFHHNGIMNHSVPCYGKTKYHGEQQFICDSVAEKEFYLHDETRGEGIVTRDQGNNVWRNNSSFWDLTANGNEIAIDLHYGMQSFFDFMLNQFGWSGIDNNGGQLISKISEDHIINAFWNGSYATFGRGDCNHGPLTTLEVIGHELMHGVTEHSSGLIYSNESGAINESLSDIFGKALEYFVNPSEFDWLLGESFLLTEFGTPSRSFEDPNQFEDPKFYKGRHWSTIGRVHSNSGVGNHWFYLLVEGGDGMNEVGDSYSINGLGMSKAIQIVYQTQVAYLFASSDYNNYSEFSILATEELFGQNSDEVKAVKEAWRVVGLPSNDKPVEKDLSVTLNLESSSTCLNQESLPFEVIVHNHGLSDFDPLTESAKLILNKRKIILELNDIIPAGASKRYTFNAELIIDKLGQQEVEVSLNYPDDLIKYNNKDFQLLWNAFPSGQDISISRVFTPRELTCDSKDEVELRFTNNSCFPTAGTEKAELIFRRTTGLVLDRVDIELPRLAKNENVIRSYAFSARGQVGEITVELKYSDSNEDNNTITVDIGRIGRTKISTSFDFERGIMPRQIGSVHLDKGFFIDHNQDVQYAVTGPNTFNIVEPCLSFEGAIKSYSSGKLKMCADLEGIESPVLHFDLTQFRDEKASLENELLKATSFVVVRYSADGVIQEHIIYDAEEGKEQRYYFPLQKEYKGEIEIEFVCRRGSDPNYLDFFDYDVILIDDITIRNTVSTNSPTQNDIKFYPNPSSGEFWTSPRVELMDCRIFDLNGQILMSTPKASIVDLSSLPSGLYILKARISSGEEILELLTKI